MNIKKFFRYVLSGYVFERESIIKSLKQANDFVPSNYECKLPRIAVYTVSTGGYDIVKEPRFVDKQFDYYVFTNSKLPTNTVWKVIPLDGECENMAPFDQSRYVKTHPHLFFADYDISIYIDGNIQIIKNIRPLIYKMIEENKTIAIHRHNCRDCIYHEARIIWAQGRAKLLDILKQVCYYKRIGFPSHFGLFENNVIVRFHNDPKCKAVMETWWNEIKTRSKRDQLSFTYSLWKNGLTSDYVMSLGNCSRNSEYFSVVNHK